MKQRSPSRVNAQLADLPIARLDAQDLEQSLPLREYLEQNGVAVVVGRKTAIPEAYHIICGDLGFVKEVIASISKSDRKPFVVLSLTNREKAPMDLLAVCSKIAAVTGTTIEARDVQQIFAYFFTSDEEIIYIENDQRPMMELKPVDREKNDVLPIIEESFTSDADRVSRVIGEMFEGPKKRDGERREKMRKPKKTFKKNWIVSVSLLAIGILIAPVMWYLASIGIITAVQWYEVGALRRGHVLRTATVTRVTTYWLGQGKGALALIGLPAKLFGVGAGGIVRSQERVLSVMGDIVSVETKAAQLFAESSKVAPILLAGPNERDPGEPSLPVMIDRMRLALDGLTNSLGLAGAQLRLMRDDRQFPFTISFIRAMARRGEEEVTSALAHAAAIRNLLALYRAAGGFDGKKTYLIILQNSMELRPTGGFIGSIATVTMEDGVIATPVVQDVYVLDGQLKGHIDPPTPIKELLGQEHWYLRDSNWDPDFRVSGARAAWFYQKETGGAVDGVIAISTPVFTDILGVTGPLDLPDYNDRITKENFFGKSLFYTKADFFPGSTQKKDFLGNLMVALMGRLTSGSPGDHPALMRVVGSVLARGDIQFWFSQGQAQAIAGQAGWTGEVENFVPCQTLLPPCMVERVALVESNMGVNKVNSYIKRSVKTRVDLDENGTADGSIAITYQNTSTDDAALSGGGTYLAYLRAFLPPDAFIVSATLDGAEISGKAAKAAERATPYRDTDETTDGSTIVSVAFTVPPGGERRVAITYRRGILMTFTDDEMDFVVSIRKQPGMTDTTLDAAIGYPLGWRVESEGKAGLLATSREVRYNTTLDQTKVFTVRFRK